jgi:hypothetical protein
LVKPDPNSKVYRTLNPEKARRRWDRLGNSGTGIWPGKMLPPVGAKWNALRVAATQSPSQQRTPERKAGVLDLRKRNAGERRTRRWSERDSNHRSPPQGKLSTETFLSLRHFALRRRDRRDSREEPEVVMRKAPTKADSIIFIVGSITLKLPWLSHTRG